MGVVQAVLLVAQARQVLGGGLDLAAHGLGLATQLLEGHVDLEEGAELVLERQRRLHLVAHLVEAGADGLDLLEPLGDLLLGAMLSALDVLGALLERLVLLGELHHPGEAVLQVCQPGGQRVHVARGAGHGLAELLQSLGRGAGGLDERLVAGPLLLHLVQEGARVVREFAVLGGVAEQIPEEGGHHELPVDALAARPGRDRRISRVTDVGDPRRDATCGPDQKKPSAR